MSQILAAILKRDNREVPISHQTHQFKESIQFFTSSPTLSVLQFDKNCFLLFHQPKHSTSKQRPDDICWIVINELIERLFWILMTSDKHWRILTLDLVEGEGEGIDRRCCCLKKSCMSCISYGFEGVNVFICIKSERKTKPELYWQNKDKIVKTKLKKK